jgi:hypothetical protein
MSEFAANCPEDCPPAAAADVNGDIYRFVRKDPPAFEDMRSWEDEKRNPGQGDPCGRCALSVLTRAEDIPAAIKAIPFFRRLHVAKAALKPEHGKICQAGKHRWHYNLWVRAVHGATIHQAFSVVTS